MILGNHLRLFDISSNLRSRERRSEEKARVLQQLPRLPALLTIEAVIDHTNTYAVVRYSLANDRQSQGPLPKRNVSENSVFKEQLLFTPPDLGILTTASLSPNSRRISTLSFSWPMTMMTFTV